MSRLTLTDALCALVSTPMMWVKGGVANVFLYKVGFMKNVLIMVMLTLISAFSIHYVRVLLKVLC